LHSEDDGRGFMKMVMSGSAVDGPRRPAAPCKTLQDGDLVLRLEESRRFQIDKSHIADPERLVPILIALQQSHSVLLTEAKYPQ
jgi:hypothetical protein